MRLLILAAALALLQSPPEPMKVLFIGNSLTYANDLPGMVQTLARAAAFPLTTGAVAFPDFSLEDHWRDGRARAAIATGGWTHVVLQQGPSALPESRRLLIEYTKRFDAEIRKAGAATALYTVWPPRQRRGDFDAVSRSYAAAAKEVHGRLLPVGDAWRAAWALDRDLRLWGEDGFHPTPAASYLGALVVYRGLTGRDAISRPLLGGVTPEVGDLLQGVVRGLRVPGDARLKPSRSVVTRSVRRSAFRGSQSR